MSRLFVPRPWQADALMFALHRSAINVSSHGMSRCSLFSGVGTGKTATAFAWFDSLYRLGYARRCLVLAPLRVILNSWTGEREKWLDSFGHLSIAVAAGTPKQRLAAINRFADITLTNYDNLTWLVELVGDRWPWDTVIADESSRLKGLRVSLDNGTVRGQGASRARALIGVAHKRVRNWLNMTGSPASNGLQDLYGPQLFVDAGAALGTSSGAFLERWFTSREGPSGRMELRPLKHAEAEIAALMRPTTMTVTLPFNPVEVREVIVPVTLPPKARRVYDELQAQLFSEIEAGVSVQVYDPAGLSTKCLQVACSGCLMDGEYHELHDEKLQALDSLMTELNGQNVLLRYTYTADRDRILKRFPYAVFLDKRPETVDAFVRGEIRMLVCHAASAGHGLSLQNECWTLIEFGVGWNLEEDVQIIGRIGPMRQYQIGRSDRQVTRYRIIATDTIEETSVLPRLRSKMSVEESLKAAMERTR